MRKAKQIDLFENVREHAPRRLTHGGEPSRGLRKIARPLDRKRPVHLVLKSDEARGRFSLLSPKNHIAIERILKRRARQFAVKIHRREIMSNHIHIVASFANRTMMQNFLRTFAALVAREVTGARRGRPFVSTWAREFECGSGARGQKLGGGRYVERPVMHVTRTSRYAPSKTGRKFWRGLLFSRVVTGLRDFRGVGNYLAKNQIEREVNIVARRSVEEYERAERQARQRGCDVWEILEASG